MAEKLPLLSPIVGQPMKCPYCREDNDRVIDSRAKQDGFAIRRRRQCLSCGRRYTTYERVEEAVIKVIKKDGAREAFDREKIKRGLEKACWKRPISEAQLESILSSVEDYIYSTFETEVDSSELGELIISALREVDQIAYIRFASVYREFKDVKEFVDELQPMLRKPAHIESTHRDPEHGDSS